MGDEHSCGLRTGMTIECWGKQSLRASRRTQCQSQTVPPKPRHHQAVQESEATPDSEHDCGGMFTVNNCVVDNHPVLVDRSARSLAGENSHFQHSTNSQLTTSSALWFRKGHVRFRFHAATPAQTPRSPPQTPTPPTPAEHINRRYRPWSRTLAWTFALTNWTPRCPGSLPDTMGIGTVRHLEYPDHRPAVVRVLLSTQQVDRPRSDVAGSTAPGTP